jgi:DNA-binding response OmpR family regulator
MPCSFLIVDADRNFREALAISLRLDGYEVAVAASADDALAQLARGGARCCVVDAHLHDADRVVTAAARSGHRHVLTGPYADLLVAAGRRHPAAELLAKPFRASELTRGCRTPAGASAPVAIGDRRARG